MLIFTSCSSTKHVPVPVALRAGSVRSHTLGAFAQEWVSRVDAAEHRYSAAEVYGGVGVAAAQEASACLSAPLYFVSAGLSLVGPRDRIPGYDLTISSGGAVPPPLASSASPSSAWWMALNDAFDRSNPLATAVRRCDDLVLIALPESYLQMIQPELLGLTERQRRKLRLITASRSTLSPELETQAIRYDQRFQSNPRAPRGALASFTQRALWHFAGLLCENPRARAVAAQRQLVEAALCNTQLKTPQKRSSRSDLEITAWVQRTDPHHKRSRSALLTIYRGKGYACEQKRFFGLVASART